MSTYKTCGVPMCGNTSLKNPEKLFILVPKNPDRRRHWLHLARREPKPTTDKMVIFFCEDHFDLPNDIENYEEYTKMGAACAIKLKPNCAPMKFQCQIDEIKRLAREKLMSTVSISRGTTTKNMVEERFPQGSEMPSKSGMTKTCNAHSSDDEEDWRVKPEDRERLGP